MKIQLDIPKKINKELQIYKIRNDFKNLQEAVIDILKRKLLKGGGKKNE